MIILKKIRFLAYMMIIFLLSGCTLQKQKVGKFEKKDRAPKSLGGISSGLQELLDHNKKIEELLDNTYIEEDKEKSDEKSEDEEKEDDNKKEDKEKPEEKPKEKTEEEERREKLKKTWQAMDKKIEELHKEWNKYEGEAIKKGGNPDKMAKFSESLNLLTKAIENRKVSDVYNYGSLSMQNISQAFDLYKDEIWGEINKIKYASYQSYLKFISGQFTLATRLLEDSREEISKIRLKLEKDDSKIKLLDKVNLSIGDMQKSFKENSLKLVRIKKDIIINNLEELGK